MIITEQQVAAQLKKIHANGLEQMLTASATAHGLLPLYVIAIASRETNCVNELGDIQDGEAHGVGPMQIDVQHALARQMRDDGTWKTNPAALIDFGCQLLAHNIHLAAQHFPGMAPEQQLKIAASGYNCGIKRAIEAQNAYNDSDRYTTGKDYGADVMARKAMLDDLAAKQVPPAAPAVQ